MLQCFNLIIDLDFEDKSGINDIRIGDIGICPLFY